MLTLQKLQDMPPNTIFASGKIANSPEGIFMTNSNQGRELLWIAKRGEIHDWAIYCHWADTSTIEFVKENGDKVTSENNVKKLVPCDEQAYNMYRR